MPAAISAEIFRKKKSAIGDSRIMRIENNMKALTFGSKRRRSGGANKMNALATRASTAAAKAETLKQDVVTTTSSLGTAYLLTLRRAKQVHETGKSNSFVKDIPDEALLSLAAGIGSMFVKGDAGNMLKGAALGAGHAAVVMAAWDHGSRMASDKTVAEDE